MLASFGAKRLSKWGRLFSVSVTSAGEHQAGAEQLHPIDGHDLPGRGDGGPDLGGDQAGSVRPVG